MPFGFRYIKRRIFMKALLESAFAVIHREHRNAVATICIGDDYWDVWRGLCQNNWIDYCDKFNLDLIVVRTPLDQSESAKRRSPAWQKLLLLSQPWSREYERIVWLDSDIVISPWAPDIVAATPNPARIGVVESGSQLSEAERHIYLERSYKVALEPDKANLAWSIHTRNQFEGAGITQEAVTMYNTGVLVLDPRAHADLFFSVYEKQTQSRLYEQPHLSLEIHNRKIAQLISSRFNWSVHEFLVMLGKDGLNFEDRQREIAVMAEEVKNEKLKSYFLHFCGSIRFMTLMNKLIIFKI